MVAFAPAAASFPHPLDGLPVKRTFTTQALAIFPTAVLTEPDHPWLRRQEQELPRGVLGVVYYRDGVDLVRPSGITRRPFVGEVCGSAPEAAPPPSLPSLPTPRQTAAAARTAAWKAANREKVKAQRQRAAQRRKAERDQLRDAIAASHRAA